MARPEIPKESQKEIMQLRAQGLSLYKIQSEMQQIRILNPNLPPVPSLKTIEKYMKQYDKIPEGEKRLDQSFELGKLDEYLGGDYGIPWEASAYILEMWAWVMEGGGDLRLEEKFDDWSGMENFGLNLLGQPPRPTVRVARWWWRIHLAAPDLDNEMVYIKADHFAQNDQARQAFNIPVEMEGLWAYLGYKPWTSKANLKKYQQAIEQGRTPAPQVMIMREGSQFRSTDDQILWLYDRERVPIILIKSVPRGGYTTIILSEEDKN